MLETGQVIIGKAEIICFTLALSPEYVHETSETGQVCS
jgi:hypothetical protein